MRIQIESTASLRKDRDLILVGVFSIHINDLVKELIHNDKVVRALASQVDKTPSCNAVVGYLLENNDSFILVQIDWTLEGKESAEISLRLLFDRGMSLCANLTKDVSPV